MKRISLTLRLLAIALLVPILTVSAQDYAKTFSVSPGGLLRLDVQTGGAITITGSGNSQVEVNVFVSGRDGDEVIVDLEELRNGVSVSTEYERRNSRADVDIKVSVPTTFDLDLQTMGGEITVNGVSGKLVGKTMGGELQLRSLGGDINFETMGGEIHLEDSDVSGRVHTMGGEITINNVNGNVNATTMGGEVSYNNYRPRSASGANAEVKIHTMGGDINVDRADYGADVETMGGAININRAGDHVKASTMGGEVVIKEVDGWVEASTMGGDVEVHMVGDASAGNRHVEVSSMGGDILLTVPDGLSMDIEAEITVSGRHQASDYKVISDFNLSTEQTSATDRRSRDETHIVATGTVGSGKNKIRVKTVNGDIRILRSR